MIKKLIKGIGMVFIGLIILSLIVGPPPSSDKKPSTSSVVVTTTTTPVVVSFDETLTNRLNEEATFYADITLVDYNESNVIVFFYQDLAWDENMLRDAFAFETYAIMDILVDYPDKINEIGIVGETKLIDMSGNEKVETIYFVQTDMNNAVNVKWDKLKGLNTIEVLKANFKTVKMHDLIMPQQ